MSFLEHTPSGRSELRSRSDSMCYFQRQARLLLSLTILIFIHNPSLWSLQLSLMLIIFIEGSRKIHLYGRFDYLPYYLEAFDMHGHVISKLEILVDPSDVPSGEIRTTNLPVNRPPPSSPGSCNQYMQVNLSFCFLKTVSFFFIPLYYE